MKQVSYKDTDFIDLKGSIRKILSRWYLFVLGIALMLTAGYFFNRFSDKIYRVKSTILVRDKSNASVGAENLIQGLELFSIKKNLENEIELIRSRKMIFDAVDKLDFKVSYFTVGDVKTMERYGKFPFQVVLDSSMAQIVNVPVHVTLLPNNKYKITAQAKDVQVYDYKTRTVKKIKNRNLNLNKILELGDDCEEQDLSYKIIAGPDLDLYKGDKFFFVVNDLNTIVENYQKSLTVKVLNKESSVLELAVEGPIPQKETNFLDKLCQVYIDFGLDEKNRIASSTIDFIDHQLSGISQSLKNTETELEDFRSKNKIMDLEQTATNAYTKLEKLESERGSLDLKLKYYNYILKYLKGNKTFKDIIAPSSIGINDPLLNDQILELSKLNQEKAVLSYSATSSNPYLEMVEVKIKNTKETLLENIQNIINSSNITRREMSDRIQELEVIIGDLPRTERNLIDIERRFKLNDHIYNYLLEKRAEAGIAKASNTSDNKIIDTAAIEGSKPVWPKTVIIYVFSVLLGLVFPLGFILISDMMNDKVAGKNDIEKVTAIPVLGKIRHNSFRTDFPVSDNPDSEIAEEFTALAINLQQVFSGLEGKIIGVSSAMDREGKSFCAINLASSLPMNGKRAIFISADMRSSTSAFGFSENTSTGLSSFLANTAHVEEIIHSTSIANLDAIPAGAIVANPGRFLQADKLNELFSVLKNRYQYIVLDIPAAGQYPDYLALLNYLDISLFVVRHKVTKMSRLAEVHKVVKEYEGSNPAIVVNDLKQSSAAGYEYKLYYNKKKITSPAPKQKAEPKEFAEV